MEEKNGNELEEHLVTVIRKGKRNFQLRLYAVGQVAALEEAKKRIRGNDYELITARTIRNKGYR